MDYRIAIVIIILFSIVCAVLVTSAMIYGAKNEKRVRKRLEKWRDNDWEVEHK